MKKYIYKKIQSRFFRETFWRLKPKSAGEFLRKYKKSFLSRKYKKFFQSRFFRKFVSEKNFAAEAEKCAT